MVRIAMRYRVFFITIITMLAFPSGAMNDGASLRKRICRLLKKKDNLSYLGGNSPLLEPTLYTECSDLLPELLRKKADPNAKLKTIPYGTPLSLAIRSKNTDALALLIQAGAQATPQHLISAICLGYIPSIELLLKLGVSPNGRINDSGYEETPFFVACNRSILVIGYKKLFAILSLLLRYGGSPLEKCDGKTILSVMKNNSSQLFLKDCFGIHNEFEAAYRKIGRALVHYTILFKILHKNQCWPTGIVVNILRFVDYGLDEKSEPSNS